MRLDDAIETIRHDPQPTDLYRYYDAAGSLLYVGVSKSVVARAMQHERQARWWARWSMMVRETYATRDEALAAERVAIERERPLFNVMHAVLEEKAAGY